MMNNGIIVTILGLIITIIATVALTDTPMFAACGAGIAITLAGVVLISKNNLSNKIR